MRSAPIRDQVGDPLISQDAGFFVVDLGGLRKGGDMQQVGAPLAGPSLIHLP